MTVTAFHCQSLLCNETASVTILDGAIFGSGKSSSSFWFAPLENKSNVKINPKLNLLLVFNFSAKKKLMQGEMTNFMKKIVKIGKIARYSYKAKKRGGEGRRWRIPSGFGKISSQNSNTRPGHSAAGAQVTGQVLAGQQGQSRGKAVNSPGEFCV